MAGGWPTGDLNGELIDEAGATHFRSVVPSAAYTDVAGARHMVAGDENNALGAGGSGVSEYASAGKGLIGSG